MPELKDLNCCIEYGPHKTVLREYATRYNDGYVETHIAVPEGNRTFEVHLMSKAYIAPGLAVFVYIDGVAQCNRNKRGLVKPTGGSDNQKSLVDFRLRQKEDKVGNDRWLARPWTFEELQTTTENATESPDESHFESVGNIEVVVLRCQDRASSSGKDGSQTSSQKARPSPSGPMIQVPLPRFGFDGVDERHLGRSLNISPTSSTSAPFDGTRGRQMHSHHPQPRSAYPPPGPPRNSPESRYTLPDRLQYYSTTPNYMLYDTSLPRQYPDHAYPPQMLQPTYDRYVGRGPSPPMSGHASEDESLGNGQKYEAHHKIKTDQNNLAANLSHNPHYPSPSAPHPYFGDRCRYDIPLTHQPTPYWAASSPPRSAPGIISAQKGTYSPKSGAKILDNYGQDEKLVTSKESKTSGVQKEEKKDGNNWNTDGPANTDWGKQGVSGVEDKGNNGWDTSNNNNDQADVTNDWSAKTDNARNDTTDWDANKNNSNDNVGGWGTDNEPNNNDGAGWGANDNAANNDGAWIGNEQNKTTEDSTWNNNTPDPQNSTNDVGGNDAWNANNQAVTGHGDAWDASGQIAGKGDDWTPNTQTKATSEILGWGEKSEEDTKKSTKKQSKKDKQNKKAKSSKPEDDISTKVGISADADQLYLKPYFSTGLYYRGKDDLKYTKSTDIVPPEPLLNVPSHIADKIGATHQVRGGSAFLYNHYIGRPEYMDSMNRPYAVFCFKYRSRDKLGELFPDLEKDGKIKKERGDWKKRMMGMDKEELLVLLRKAKSAAGYHTDSSLESTDDENDPDSSMQEQKQERKSDKKEKNGKSKSSW